MNEYESTERRLKAWRNVFIAFALIGIVGIYTNGIVAHRDGMATTWTAFALTSGVLSALWGAKLGDHRKTVTQSTFSRDTRAVSPVIAVILMVAITVVLAATVFVLVQDIGANHNPPTPAVSWSKDQSAKTLTVSSVSQNNLKWSDMTVTGCTKPGSGNVTAGNMLTACAGHVVVVYKTSNSVLYETDF